MLKVFDLYVLVVFAMKEYVTLTHRVTLIIVQASPRSMNSQSWVSHLSFAPSVSHVENVCLDGLGHFIIKSCECVFIWSPMHLLIIHTISHSNEVLTTRLPSDSQTITLPSNRSTVNQNNTEAPSYYFQVALPVRNLIKSNVGHVDSRSRKSPWDWLSSKISQMPLTSPIQLTKEIV